MLKKWSGLLMLGVAIFAGSYFADKWDAKAWLNKMMNKGESSSDEAEG